MKKLIMLAAIAAVGNLFALNQMSATGMKSHTTVTPVTIKALCIENPGGKYGVSETVKVQRLNTMNYDRAYTTTISEYGTGDTMIPTKLLYSAYAPAQ